MGLTSSSVEVGALSGLAATEALGSHPTVCLPPCSSIIPALMDIEDVAEKTPEAIHSFTIDPVTGMMPYTARQIAFALQLEGKQVSTAVKFLLGLYRAFTELDCCKQNCLNFSHFSLSDSPCSDLSSGPEGRGSPCAFSDARAVPASILSALFDVDL